MCRYGRAVVVLRSLGCLFAACCNLVSRPTELGGSIRTESESFTHGHAALGGIVGQMTPDDLLGEIFASFCIGK